MTKKYQKITIIVICMMVGLVGQSFLINAVDNQSINEDEQENRLLEFEKIMNEDDDTIQNKIQEDEQEKKKAKDELAFLLKSDDLIMLENQLEEAHKARQTRQQQIEQEDQTLRLLKRDLGKILKEVLSNLSYYHGAFDLLAHKKKNASIRENIWNERVGLTLRGNRNAFDLDTSLRESLESLNALAEKDPYVNVVLGLKNYLETMIAYTNKWFETYKGQTYQQDDYIVQHSKSIFKTLSQYINDIQKMQKRLQGDNDLSEYNDLIFREVDLQQEIERWKSTHGVTRLTDFIDDKDKTWKTLLALPEWQKMRQEMRSLIQVMRDQNPEEAQPSTQALYQAMVQIFRLVDRNQKMQALLKNPTQNNQWIKDIMDRSENIVNDLLK